MDGYFSLTVALTLASPAGCALIVSDNRSLGKLAAPTHTVRIPFRPSSPPTERESATFAITVDFVRGTGDPSHQQFRRV
jgi:hypothetical protein